MEPDLVYDAYLSALNAGIKQVSIADATGIPVESLRAFKASMSLGRGRREKLSAWLEKQGFHGRENLDKRNPDVLVEVRKKLEACLSVLDNPLHGRDRKARIVLNEIEVLHREYGPELHEMGKLIG